MKPGHTRLFRAVLTAELNDLKRLSAFRNPLGSEVKYFALNEWHASIYADLASTRFDEGPYFLVATWLPTGLLIPEYRVAIEYGIVAVVLPTDLLGSLSSLT